MSPADLHAHHRVGLLSATSPGVRRLGGWVTRNLGGRGVPTLHSKFQNVTGSQEPGRTMTGPRVYDARRCSTTENPRTGGREQVEDAGDGGAFPDPADA